MSTVTTVSKIYNVNIYYRNMFSAYETYFWELNYTYFANVYMQYQNILTRTKI